MSAQQPGPRPALYRAVLGAAWEQLPRALREMHQGGDLAAEGRAEVERGRGWPARFVAMLFGFPPAGREVPLRVEFSRCAGGETWRRDFDGKVFSSRQCAGHGCSRGLLCERFGPFEMGLALLVREQKLFLLVRRWSMFGVPLPAFLAPGGTTYEYEQDGRFHFHVEIRHPWLGLLVAYRGWLLPLQD